MKDFRNHLFATLAGIIIGLLIAMGVSRCNRQPVEVKVERDTIVHYDTIPHYYPKPVEVTKTRTEYRWLTKVEHFTDTLTRTDSVLVEVPIESRHYHSDEYDAWVSGYEPSLDSIFIRQRTEYITETIIQSKPPNKWGLDIIGGVDYNTVQKIYTPYAAGELMYQPSRLQFGIQGGVMMNDNKAEPFVGIKGKFTIF